MMAWGISQLMDAAGTNKAQPTLRDPVGIVWRHVTFGVVGLPTDDFKGQVRLAIDVIHSRQASEFALVLPPALLAGLVAVGPKQLAFHLHPVVRVNAVGLPKGLVDSVHRLPDGVAATALAIPTHQGVGLAVEVTLVGVVPDLLKPGGWEELFRHRLGLCQLRPAWRDLRDWTTVFSIRALAMDTDH